MKLQIKSKSSNALFNRTEIKFSIDHAGESTPSRKELKDLLSANMSVDLELVVIKNIISSFGSRESTGLIYVYKSKKDLERIEREYILKRGTKKKEKKPAPVELEGEKEGSEEAEKPAEDAPVEETPTEEKPAEEKKEEPKEEADK